MEIEFLLEQDFEDIANDFKDPIPLYMYDNGLKREVLGIADEELQTCYIRVAEIRTSELTSTIAHEALHLVLYDLEGNDASVMFDYVCHEINEGDSKQPTYKWR